MEPRETVKELVYRTCAALDDQDFDRYLSMCDDQYHYKITAYSPEIKQEMIWLEHDREGIKKLFKNLPKHNSDNSPLTRHATVYSVDWNGDQEANVVTALQVFKTKLDGGATMLYAVGKMYDKVKVNGEDAKLVSRKIHLDTRELGIGHHVPF